VIDKDKLYDLIDQDDEMTDKEKRDAYFGEIEESELEQEWQNQYQN
jgi:hypothetical protein